MLSKTPDFAIRIRHTFYKFIIFVKQVKVAFFSAAHLFITFCLSLCPPLRFLRFLTYQTPKPAENILNGKECLWHYTIIS